MQRYSLLNVLGNALRGNRDRCDGPLRGLDDPVSAVLGTGERPGRTGGSVFRWDLT